MNYKDSNKNNKVSKGDHVLYGSCGICLIEDIKELSFGKSKEFYYILKPINDTNLTLYVPMENDLLTSKMKTIPSVEEFQEIIRSVKEKDSIWINDRTKRLAIFHEILNNGNPSELILLIASIYQRKKELICSGKKLSFTDESILKKAEKTVGSELSYILNLSEDDVPSYISSLLNI